MGQSAGSMSIALLQTSPLAKGLFERIIGLSGSTYTSPSTDQIPSLTEGEKRGLALQAALGATDIAALRRMQPDRIVAAQGPTASPIVDGLFLPQGPAAIFAAHGQADVPLLIGTVRDETLSPISRAVTLADYRATLAKLYGDRADAILKLYPATDDMTARAASQRLGHDIGFSTMMRSWARMQGANGKAPVFAYLFDRVHPYTPGVVFSDLDPKISGVNHTDDVPYWLGTFDTFNTFRPTRDWSDDDRQLGDRMASALIAFAATGDPNGTSLGTHWPRYDAKTETMLGFGTGIRVVTWPDRDKLDALAAIGIPQGKQTSR
jgi:para-nitrobenzyl esterase